MKLLNRQEKGNGKNWEPKPAAANPTLNLGYSLFTPPKSTRKQPTARTPTSETHVDEQFSSVMSTDHPVTADAPTNHHRYIAADLGCSLPDSQCEQYNILSKHLNE